LVDSIKIKISESSTNRQLTDEEESRDLRILNFVDRACVPLGQNKDFLKDNPLGWIPVEKMYAELKNRFEEYEINPDYFTRNTLTQTLHRLGFKKDKKSMGISWHIIKDNVHEVKKRMGYFDNQNDTLEDSVKGGLDIVAEPAKPAKGAGLGTNDRNDPATPATIATPAPKVRGGSSDDNKHNPAILQQPAIDENSKSAGSAGMFFCHTCEAGWYNVGERSKSSGDLLHFHQNLDHDVEIKKHP